MANAFLEALRADGPAADRGDKMETYSWLIGSWALEVTEYLPGEPPRRRRGEWHFGWILEGRAIQDVWIVPPRGERRAGDPRAYYGSTLRMYDATLDAWHIRYMDPVYPQDLGMIGRKEGPDIVQLGKSEDGRTWRWRFLDITPTSFLWRGEVSADGGLTWNVHTEFTARRE